MKFSNFFWTCAGICGGLLLSYTPSKPEIMVWRMDINVCLESEDWKVDRNYDLLVEGKDKEIILNQCKNITLAKLGKEQVSFASNNSPETDTLDIYCTYRDPFMVTETAHIICKYDKKTHIQLNSGITCEIANIDRIGDFKL